jgi:hypothetical protein
LLSLKDFKASGSDNILSVNGGKPSQYGASFPEDVYRDVIRTIGILPHRDAADFSREVYIYEYCFSSLFGVLQCQ